MGSLIFLLITALNGFLKLEQEFFTTNSETVLKEGMDHFRIYEKVFPLGTPKDMLVLDGETEEEFQLFHFLLRLNSAIGK
jgi:hypothetical protein